jgi:hypothetical protein
MHTIVPIKAARKRFVGHLIIVTRADVPEQAVQSENLLSNEVWETGGYPRLLAVTACTSVDNRKA